MIQEKFDPSTSERLLSQQCQSEESSHEEVAENTYLSSISRSSQARWLKAAVLILLVLYVPLLVMVSSMFFQRNWSEPSIRGTHEATIPAAKGVVQYERRRMLALPKNHYFGPPGPESDRAWHELLEGHQMRVSGDDLQYLNVSSLPLGDGSGYAGFFSVFHELHCLKVIRQYIHRDHYHINATEDEMAEHLGHTNHCLESLRLNSMCHADTTLNTFRWLQPGDKRPTAEDRALHTCVKWDPLVKWVRERSIDIGRPDTLGRD